jgi:hypothetical protein
MARLRYTAPMDRDATVFEAVIVPYAAYRRAHCALMR